jgi:hypothetical protein
LANVHDNLIIAFPCPPESGSPYSLTLASRLGHMLEMAEQRFGPRDKSYTILGFEFRAGLPQIWFPGDGMNVIVQLDSANLNDQNLPLLPMQVFWKRDSQLIFQKSIWRRMSVVYGSRVIKSTAMPRS